jgi:hypothetical protein
MGMGVSNLLDLLQLPTFTHLRGEGGHGGAVVDSLSPVQLTAHVAQ